MTLANINNNKDKSLKVELKIIDTNDDEINTLYFKNWKCFIRTKAYQKYINYSLVYCIIRAFKDKDYIAVCVKKF